MHVWKHAPLIINNNAKNSDNESLLHWLVPYGSRPKTKIILKSGSIKIDGISVGNSDWFTLRKLILYPSALTIGNFRCISCYFRLWMLNFNSRCYMLYNGIFQQFIHLSIITNTKSKVNYREFKNKNKKIEITKTAAILNVKRLLQQG